MLTACQDYLETNPDSTFDVQIDSEDKIAELLAGAYPEASYFAFLEARTDNVGERTNGIHSRMKLCIIGKITIRKIWILR